MAGYRAATDNAVSPLVRSTNGAILLKLARAIATIAMNVLFVVAVLLVAYIVVRYFGALGKTALGEVILALGGLFVIPFGLPEVRSLYGGVFDADAAVTVVAILGVEWLLSLVRSRI